MSKKFEMLYTNHGWNYSRSSLQIECRKVESTKIEFYDGEGQLLKTHECNWLGKPEKIELPVSAESQMLVKITNPSAVNSIATTGYVADVEFDIRDLNLFDAARSISFKTVGNISGNFNDLHLPEIREFELAICYSTKYPIGSLNVIGEMKNLKVLTLHLPKYNGSIRCLSNLKDLRCLSLYVSTSQDAEFLNNFKNLEILDLENANYNLHIVDMAKLDLPKLIKLHLDRVSVSHMSEISKFSALEKLYLANLIPFDHDVDALIDLSWFKSLTRLKYLYSRWNPCTTGKMYTTGNLSSIENLCDLEKLIINGKVYGDLCDLQRMRNLDELNLRGTKIRGLLKELTLFGNDKFQLKGLDLSETPISGDLVSLKPLRNLEYLKLNNTTVCGDLANLEDMKNLQFVDLSKTGVTGYISNLSEHKSLYLLKLNDTYVSGNVNGLSEVPMLEKLYISNTDVFGNAEDITKDIPSLKRFDYHHSRVNGSWKIVEPQVNDQGMVSAEDYNSMKESYETKIAELEKQLSEARSAQ